MRDMAKKKAEKAVKAYRDDEFLNSAAARPIRILSEFLEPNSRFQRHHIRDTIVFFGSSRARPESKVRADIRELNAKVRRIKANKSRYREKYHKLDMELKLARYYEEAAELSRRLTVWAKRLKQDHRFAIVSGGGPGIMEAANLGASLAKGLSIGLNISLPFEQYPNRYISSGYNFEFHYFFMRKLWFASLARAMVVFPGGFGTMDELFELLTLRQTGKIRKHLPIVLYGSEFWDEVVDFDAFIRWGTISKGDLKLFRRCDDVDDAYKFLVKELGGR